MRSLFSSLMAAVVLAFTLSYAGMAVFGMGMVGMTMSEADCVGAECHGPSHSPVAGVDCVEHCLGLIPDSAPSVASPLAGVIVLASAAILAFMGRALSAQVDAARQRWREGIGKVLRHRELATVIVRD